MIMYLWGYEVGENKTAERALNEAADIAIKKIEESYQKGYSKGYEDAIQAARNAGYNIRVKG